MDARSDKPATKKGLDLVRKDLDQVKQELTDKIDANGRKIDANSAKIDMNGKKIDANSAKIDRVEQRLTVKIDANSAKLDRIASQVTENRERLSKTLTKEEYKKDYNELLRGQDEMMVILTRLDEERVATTGWIRRVEGDVETNTGEIKKIKTKLAMP